MRLVMGSGRELLRRVPLGVRLVLAPLFLRNWGARAALGFQLAPASAWMVLAHRLKRG